ncbi:MAG: hypothetical protein Hals2KO_30220 [Halioglobus sp.]
MSALGFSERDVTRDQASVESRLEAFREIDKDPSTPLLVSTAQEDFGEDTELPQIAATELCAEVLRNAMQQQGCLLVRGLFPNEATTKLQRAIDHVLDACEANAAGDAPQAHTFFAPPQNLSSIMPRHERELGNTRSFHRESGSAMCIEAPSIAEELLRWYELHELKNLLTDYFGEKPCLSAKKWVLRRSRLPVAEAGWHQDGAFMGTDINSLNMWLPLNACGGSTGAPGLDILPKRLSRIASADGAQFDWSVSTSQVQQEAAQTGLTSPEFAPGDALFFDHFFLHRTQYGREFSKVRYAVETWFFGESSFPKNQIPLAW